MESMPWESIEMISTAAHEHLQWGTPVSRAASGPQRDTPQSRERNGPQHQGLTLQILHTPAGFALNRNPTRTGHVRSSRLDRPRPQAEPGGSRRTAAKQQQGCRDRGSWLPRLQQVGLTPEGSCPGSGCCSFAQGCSSCPSTGLPCSNQHSSSPFPKRVSPLPPTPFPRPPNLLVMILSRI